MPSSDLDSPTGRLRVVSDGAALIRVTWSGGAPVPPSTEEDAVSRETAAQLAAYFAGRLTVFDVPAPTNPPTSSSPHQPSTIDDSKKDHTT